MATFASVSIAGIVAVWACGGGDSAPPDFSFDAGRPPPPPPPPADAGDLDVGTTPPPDTAPPPPCDYSKPFDAPVPLAAIDDIWDERGATFTPDELTLYYVTNAPGAKQDASSPDTRAFSTTRAAVGAQFAVPKPVPGALSGGAMAIEHPSITGTLLKMYMQVTPPSANPQIWLSQRADTTSPFAAPEALPDDATTLGGALYDPFITADDKQLYLSKLGGKLDLFESDHLSDGTFADPAAIREVNSAFFDERSPVVSNDGLSIFFASNRTGSLGAPPGFDIWMATRASIGGKFGVPVNLDTVNDASDDLPTFVSRDACRLYFTSGRSGGSGASADGGQDLNVWVAARPPVSQ